ncbi:MULTISPECIES: Kazal-type serine protease inhibitor domain-containing protein [Lelliottia]|uniref:Kazal-type serine protease inhibitor domain-containing protein n=1 Tax=Lelliottia TaxID=1330545 RepID=UPI003519F2FD
MRHGNTVCGTGGHAYCNACELGRIGCERAGDAAGHRSVRAANRPSGRKCGPTGAQSRNR